MIVIIHTGNLLSCYCFFRTCSHVRTSNTTYIKYFFVSQQIKLKTLLLHTPYIRLLGTQSKTISQSIVQRFRSKLNFTWLAFYRYLVSQRFASNRARYFTLKHNVCARARHKNLKLKLAPSALCVNTCFSHYHIALTYGCNLLFSGFIR